MENHYSAHSGSFSENDIQSDQDRGDDRNILGTSATSKKRRGPSIGPEEDEHQGPKKLIKTNKYGHLNRPTEIANEFVTRLGYLVRRDIPINYMDWQNVPIKDKNTVISTLGRQFEFEFEGTIDTPHTRKKLNEVWRNYKCELYKTNVEDKDPYLVKAVVPRNIVLEDWCEFVDNCNTIEFKLMSERNVQNRGKQHMPSCLGRKSAARARYELAMEKGVDVSEITRTESYMRIHTKKDKTPQNQELTDSINNNISEHPESLTSLVEDPVAKIIGPDRRGRYKGFGLGVSKTLLRMGESLLKKNDNLMLANSYLERKIETIEANMEARMRRQIEEFKAMLMSQRGTSSNNSPSPNHNATRPTHVSSPSPPSNATRSSHESSFQIDDGYYIGKPCELRGGMPLEIVARAVVQEVDPNLTFGERELEEGNFKVYVQVVKTPSVKLPCPHNQWVTTAKLSKGLLFGLRGDWHLDLVAHVLKRYIQNYFSFEK